MRLLEVLIGEEELLFKNKKIFFNYKNLHPGEYLCNGYSYISYKLLVRDWDHLEEGIWKKAVLKYNKKEGRI